MPMPESPTKSQLKAIWIGGIGIAKAAGWDFTSECMGNALYGGGRSRTYYNDSYVSNIVKSSPDYREKIDEFISEYERTGQRGFSDTIEFHNPKDLFAALQHVDVRASVESNGNMLVTITDRYDYDTIRTTAESLEELDSSDIFNAANDIGYLAQNFNVLTPFRITIYSYEWAGK